MLMKKSMQFIKQIPALLDKYKSPVSNLHVFIDSTEID